MKGYFVAFGRNLRLSNQGAESPDLKAISTPASLPDAYFKGFPGFKAWITFANEKLNKQKHLVACYYCCNNSEKAAWFNQRQDFK